MRIGIDARMFHKAGIRRYAQELINNLSIIDQKNKYIIYTSSQDRVHPFANLHHNFELRSLEAPLFSIREQLIFRSQLKNDRLDVLHTTFDFGVPLWPVSQSVVTIHDAFFGPLTFFKNYKTKFLYQLLTKYSVRRANRIIVISNFIREKLLKDLPMVKRKDENIRVILNGVGSEFYAFSDTVESSRIRQKYNIKDKYLLCVGAFASRIKNLYRVLTAFCKLPVSLREAYQLVIAGEILDRVPETLALIKELKLHERILCPGYVPDEDLPALYRNAEVFIFPSLHEGFGIPVLEAMASGIPVVTSKTAAIPEIAADAALFVDPFSEDEISTSIVKIVTNKQLKNELKEKGIVRAKKFSWRDTAWKTLKVYEEIDRIDLLRQGTMNG